jgi:hypothetical protein
MLEEQFSPHLAQHPGAAKRSSKNVLSDKIA